MRYIRKMVKDAGDRNIVHVGVRSARLNTLSFFFKASLLADLVED